MRSLKPILDSLNRKELIDAIENVRINVFKLKAAQAVWSQTMSDFVSSCPSDRLTVSISNVVELKCCPNVKFIDIFALNKICIDAEIGKISRMVELSLISPIWEVVPSSSIKEIRFNMQGEHGIEYTPADKKYATKAAENGEDGLPGKPGGPGGSFLCIGNTFISSHQLLIDVGGGEGGGGMQGVIGKKSENSHASYHYRCA